MGYCHCASCRQWSAGPINAFTLWEPTSVQVERGAPSVDSYQKTENSIRKWCKRCGGHLLTEHPKFGLVDVYAATIPSFPFVAALHVNYGETVLPIRDGLPKQKDFPEALGGSGILLPE
ncbi:MAG: aldehyde-activating protein [Myxococcaceae bacterium]|nr:aldehyde-activating protein [Myxococcaceae bacterium]